MKIKLELIKIIKYIFKIIMKNREKIILRVQNNYYNKKKTPHKIPKIIIKNEILENNIVISLME